MPKILWKFSAHKTNIYKRKKGKHPLEKKEFPPKLSKLFIEIIF
jgi:hypothetical protein